MLLISLQRLRGEYESSSRWDFFPLNSDWFLYFHFHSLSLGLAADFSPFLCSVYCHSSFFFYKTPTYSSLSLFLSFFLPCLPLSPCFAHMWGPPQAAVFMRAYGGVGGSGSNNISRRDLWAHSPHSFLENVHSDGHNLAPNHCNLKLFMSKRFKVVKIFTMSNVGWIQKDKSLKGVSFISPFFDNVKVSTSDFKGKAQQWGLDYVSQMLDWSQTTLQSLQKNVKTKNNVRLQLALEAASMSKYQIRSFQICPKSHWIYSGFFLGCGGSETWHWWVWWGAFVSSLASEVVLTRSLNACEHICNVSTVFVSIVGPKKNSLAKLLRVQFTRSVSLVSPVFSGVVFTSSLAHYL